MPNEWFDGFEKKKNDFFRSEWRALVNSEWHFF